MTVYEREILNDLGRWYVERVKDAIMNKPIRRKSVANPDSFEATVNASGRLKESVREELTEEALNVYALSYIDKLVFGQPPGERVEVTAIESWLASKGLDYNANTVTRYISKFGNSIWLEHEGKNSGLLLDIPLEQKIQEVKEKLLLRTIDEIRSDFITTFAA